MSSAAADPAGAHPSPRPIRLRGPSWLDLRLVAGVVLVLVCVLLGARIVAAADESVDVWAAASDLAAGTTLSAEDLTVVAVRLFDATPAYLDADADLVGRVLDRPVSAGELVPGSALRAPSDRVSVALPVAAAAVPNGLHRGQLVDVYASGQDTQGGAVATRLVLAAAPVQAVDGGQGSFSSSSGTRQVVVSVDSAVAGALLSAIAGRDLALAVLDDLADPADRELPTQPAGPVVPTTGAPRPTESGSAAPTSGGVSRTTG